MGERSNRAAMLLPNGPWRTPDAETERSIRVRSLELATLAVGMGALFLFGHGLGSRGDVEPLPLGVGAAATAMVFFVPDALQRRIDQAKRLISPSPPAAVYSEERLLEQWPTRSEPKTGQTAKRTLS